VTLKFNTGVSSKELQTLLLEEERKSERYANYIRLLLTALYFGVAFGIKKELPIESFNAIFIASLVNLVYGLYIYKELKGPRNPYWVKYSSISIDILLLSLVIYSFGTYRTFKNEAFLLYFLWMALSTLRFSPLLTLTAGLLCISSYVSIVLLALNAQTIELGSISQDYISEKVSIVNILLRLIFLSSFITLCVYIAYIFRVIASRAIGEHLLKIRTNKMSHTLDQLRKAQKELAEKNRELATLSEIDVLTQLYNRRKIDQIINEALQHYLHNNNYLSLIMLDIDHFKHYNDRYGHQTGDKIIRIIADILTNSARGNDFIGRWGGEEFIILCKDTHLEDAIGVAERLRVIIESTDFNIIEGVTCSFGVTQYRQGDQNNSLLKRADEALYLSKEQGRNQVSWSERQLIINPVP
jgi:diguanylate cyclase (GGDEF)-like protein